MAIFSFFKKRKIIQKKKRSPKLNKLYFNHISENSIIPILGNYYKVTLSDALRGQTQIIEDRIIVNGLKEHIPRKIELFLKELLYKEILCLAQHYSGRIDERFGKITIRNIRSRWGSCSNTKNLSFNLKLVFLPYSVMQYVVAHEICHLREMNHSRRFWQLVESIYENRLRAQQYLKTKGKKSFYYVF